MNPKIQAALDFMKDNLDRQLSINDLVFLVQLSRSRLCHLFKTEVGMAPLQYLKYLRMNKACELLETSLLSVKEIRVKVGYNDDSHFLREFKKAKDLTPSEYRAQYLLLILDKRRLERQVKKIRQ